MEFPDLSALSLTPTGAFGSHCSPHRHRKCVLITPAASLFSSNPSEVQRLGITTQSTSVLLPVPVGYAETFISPYDTLYASEWWTLVTRGLNADVEVVLGYHDGGSWTPLPSWKHEEERKMTWRIAYERGFFPRDLPEGQTLHLIFRLRRRHRQHNHAILLAMHIANIAVRMKEDQEEYAAATAGLESLDEDPPPDKRQRFSVDQAEEFLLGTPNALLDDLQEEPPAELLHQLSMDWLEDWMAEQQPQQQPSGADDATEEAPRRRGRRAREPNRRYQ